MLIAIRLLFLLLLLGIGPVLAQDANSPDPTPPGSLNPEPLPPLENPDSPKTPAKDLFGRKPTPFPGPPRSIGSYADGCLAGATVLPIDGPAWQVMRLSRNRNWGNPKLIEFLERFGANAKKVGWNGLMVGDMSQPRGGPMITGHASHQVGLDADIWLTAMPDRELTRVEREEMSAINAVAEDRRDVDPKIWTPGHLALIKAAAHDSQVERIFVNAAIKKALCRDTDPDRDWMSKVRPYWGHDYHFHVRLRCPADDHECKPQAPPPPGDGCGKDLNWWFTDAVLHPKPEPEPEPAPEHKKTGLTMARLPPACRGVLAAP